MPTCPKCFSTHADGIAQCPHDGSSLLPDGTLPENRPISPGETVGEYVIEAVIGEGGFGTVYRGRHPVIGKHAAIKVLSPHYSANPQMVARFVAEARAVNQIRHKNIVDIFSFGALPDGRRFYVMELLEGMPLDELLRRAGRLAPVDVLVLLGGVARALDAAHTQGIVHRDLKPDNVFVVFEEGQPTTAKLLDFGIAKLTSTSTSSKTRTGTQLGTPHFMSPEQCRGKDVDHRSDIYAFGIVLYRALAGVLPFDGEDVMEIMIQQSTATPTPPSQVAPGLPREVDAAILDMLQKDPALRPQTVRAAFERVMATLGQPSPWPAADASGRPSAVLVESSAPPGSVRFTPGASLRISDGSGVSVHARTQMADATSIAAGPPRALRGRVVLGTTVAGLLVFGAVGVSFIAGRTTTEKVNVAAPGAPIVTPSASATLAGEIAVTIFGAPEDAEVWLDGKPVGRAEDTIRLARRAGTITLEVRAEGYKTERVDTPGDVDATIATALEREPRAAASSSARTSPAPSAAPSSARTAPIAPIAPIAPAGSGAAR